MTSNYIVAYDGTAPARAALNVTRQLADGTRAAVVAVHVYPFAELLYVGYGDLAAPAATYADLQPAARAAAERLLDDLPEDVERCAVAGGSVPSELHRLARSRPAALLAVGATARGPVGRIVPGSVAERLLHGSPCPVLVVPEGADGHAITTIAVAYDGRDEARRALRVAASFAYATGSRLRLIGAIDPWPAGIELPPGSNGVDSELRSRLAAMLERVAGQLRRRGLEVATRSLHAAAGPGVVECCGQDVDLLVMGSRGYGPARSVMLGAASRYIVDHAPCPVLVIPRRAALAPMTETLAAFAGAGAR